MKPDIIIYSSLTNSPLHPRIEIEKKVLEESGFHVLVLSAPYLKSEMSLIYRLLYYFTLTYFRWDLIFLFSKQPTADRVIIYDFSLLPLAFFIRNRVSHIIYETIDNNVHLTFYNIKKRMPFLSIFKPFILLFYSSLEKMCVRFFVDKVIVNGKALCDYFNMPKIIVLNPYTSPFEDKPLQVISGQQKPCLLYIGVFSQEKGAAKMLETQKTYQIPLMIFGECRYKIDDISDLITFYPHQSTSALTNILRELSHSWFFIGFSLIESVNKSYETQEANKDIDYLALGVPFIGNKRPTTYEKIISGCGVLESDIQGVKELIEDVQSYKNKSENCLKYYHDHYSAKRFKQGLLMALSI